MTEIPLSELLASDVGLRVVVTSEGNAFDGMLTDFWVTRSDYDFKDRPRITARLDIKSGNGVLKIDKLPLDYRLQVDREGERA